MRKKDKIIFVLAGFSLAIILALVVSMTFILTGIIDLDKNKKFFDFDYDIDLEWDNLPEWVQNQITEMGGLEYLEELDGILIITQGDDKVYDGTPLKNENYWTPNIEKMLKEGHHLKVVNVGSQTNIGSSPNYAEFCVYDDYGNDVTSQYQVAIRFGMLTVTDADGNTNENDLGGFDKNGTQLSNMQEEQDGADVDVLTIFADTDGYVYLRNKSYGDYTGNGFAEAVAFPKGGQNQVFNYAAYCVPTANVNNVAIKIYSDKIGSFLPYYAVNEYALTDDVALDLGQTEYKVDFKNYDYLTSDAPLLNANLSDYNDFVRSNYLLIDDDLKTELVNLTHFSSVNKNLVKDITDYIKNSATYNLEYPQFPDGADMVLYFLKESKQGICQHFAAAATMMFRAYGIPARYTVGFLAYAKCDQLITVSTREAHAWVEIYLDNVGWIRIEATGGGFTPTGGEDGGIRPPQDVNDDGGTSISDNPITPADIDVLSVLTDKDGVLYLRDTSYGDYNGSGFSKAPVYSYDFNGKDGVFNPTALALGSSDASVRIKVLVSGVDNVLLPYYETDIFKLTDDVNIGATSNEYTINYAVYNYLYGADVLVPTDLSAYNRYVALSYLSIGEDLKAELLEMTGFTSSGKTLVKEIADFIKNSATYNLNFPQIPNTEDTVLYFLTTSKQGICQHFAAAATMTFRAYGIPARYTTGYVVGARGGEEQIVKAENAHAWVEIYLDDVGWIQIETTPSDGIPEFKRTIYVVSDSDSKVYDGTPLSVDMDNVSFEGELKDGHTLVVNSEMPQIVNRGAISNSPYFIIQDENGADVTDEYEINFDRCGELEITRCEIEISSSGGKVYDGSAAIDCDSGDISITDISHDRAGLIDGDYINGLSLISDDAAIYDLENSIAGIEILNADNNDVTDNYAITFDGDYEIEKRDITVKTGSESWLFDGAVHSNGVVNFYGDELAPCDVAETTGEMIGIVGTSCEFNETTDNIFEIKITRAGSGVNKTHNYNVNYEYGTLEITKIINVYSGDEHFTYDGTEHSGTYAAKYYSPEFDAEYDLPSGFTLDYDAARRTDAGETENIPSDVRVIVNGNDLTGYGYTIDYSGCYDKKIVIDKRPLTVKTADREKQYDGTPLTNGGVSLIAVDNPDIDDDGLVSGHSVYSPSNAFIGSQTVVGASANYITDNLIQIRYGGINMTSNYDITVIEGTLTVNKCVIYISSNSGNKYYNGTALVGSGYKYSMTEDGVYYTIYKYGGVYRFTPHNGDEITFSAASIVYPGYTENVPLNLTVMHDSADVGAYYEFNFDACNKLEIYYNDAITFKSESDEKQYDGTPLTNHSLDGTSTDLQSLFGYAYTVTPAFTGTITDAGTSDNLFTVAIYDGDKDVKQYFMNINYVYGTLTVSPRNITLTANDIEKIYDGNALTVSDNPVVGGDGLAAGQTVSATITGSRVNVGNGTTSIDLSTVQFFDGNGNTVSPVNYNVTNYYDGTLTVNKRPITVKTADLSKTYDGEPLTNDNSPLIVEGEYGLVTGHTISAPYYAFTGSQTAAGSSPNYITDAYIAVKYGGVNLTNNYDITVIEGTLTVIAKIKIYVSCPESTWDYDGQVHYGEYEILNEDALREGDAIISVERTSLLIGSKLNQPIITITDGIEDITDSVYQIVYENQGLLTVNPMLLYAKISGGKIYDGSDYAPQTCFTTEFYTDAGFTQLYSVQLYCDGALTLSSANAGLYDDNDSDGYYISDYNFTVFDDNNTLGCYEVVRVSGEFIIAKRAINVFTEDETVIYNGAEQRGSLIYADNLASGQSIVAEFIGHTNVGVYVNAVDENSVAILDGLNNDVKANYNILSYNFGTFEIEKYLIAFYPVGGASKTKTYDGTPLLGEYSHNAPVLSHTLLFEVASVTDPATVDNRPYNISVIDGFNNDVSENYSIDLSACSGTLKVEKILIVRQSGDKAKIYDGTPLVGNCSVSISGVALFDGYIKAFSNTDIQHTFSIVQKSITDQGSADNKAEIAVYRNGVDITDKYYSIVNGGCGKLDVYRRALTVKSADVSKPYDGEPLTNGNTPLLVIDDPYNDDDGLVQNHTVSATFTMTVTKVKTVDNLYNQVIIKDQNGKDVTDNYTITTLYGKLSVTPS